MKELTTKELADIGAKASRSVNGHKLYGGLTVDPNKSAYVSDAPFREAFAKAVRDAVLAKLVTKSDSLPDPYAELKAAHAAGKVIQCQGVEQTDSWKDCVTPQWANDFVYRIKPEPVLIPLDIDDIRATDEFRKTTSAVCVATIWTSEFISLSGTAALKYSTLATTYERRQHGSNEWKPCTKEVEV